MLDYSPAPFYSAQTFGRNGELVVEVDISGKCTVWNTDSGAVVASVRIPVGRVTSLAFAPGDASETVAIGDHLGNVSLWHFGRELVESWPGHELEVRALAWSTDGRRLCSGGADGRACVWEAETGRLLQRVDAADPAEPFGRSVRALAFHPDGEHFVVGTHSGLVRFWHMESGSPATVLQARGEWVDSAAISQAGDVLAVAGRSAAQVWNIPAGTSIGRFSDGAGFVTWVAISPDGAHVATAGHDRVVRIWNSHTAELEKQLLGLNGWVSAIEYSSDGRQVLACDGDGVAARWESATGVKLSRSRRLAAPLKGERPPIDERPLREWEVAAARFNWSELRCGCRRGARHVPGSFAELVAATTPEEASGAGLVDDVTRHGLLFEAAVPMVSVIIAALEHEELAAPARLRMLALLSSFVGGESDSTEVANGRPDLEVECCEAAEPAMALLYEELANEKCPGGGEFAFEILEELGEDPEELEVIRESGRKI
ncbi:WD40 repeat domain-containing protein [Kitasatospora sp. NPDC052896]|uniref:WD40 repeat domain-containing protein n=1 Tax=Kitasatospora sp. NPDC052896 TaxID=3364061 RepID=UPI0037CA6FB9